MEKYPGLIANNFLERKLNQKIFALNSRGQMAIEGVLLMTILVGLFLTVLKYTRDQKMVQKAVGPSIVRLKTMSAMGTWKPDGCTSPGRSRQTPGKCHPNSIHRSLSSDPGP